MINLNVRIDENLKSDVEKILTRLGLTTSEAVRIFFSQIKNTKSIPFELKVYDEPNSELQAAMMRAENYIKGKNKNNFCSYNNVKEFIDAVEEDD